MQETDENRPYQKIEMSWRINAFAFSVVPWDE
jgi:hypothetical protein